MDCFLIKPLNVGHGESILIYVCHGSREFSLLVDGGSYGKSVGADNSPVHNVELLKDIGKNRTLHGLVVSHVDDDHIGGIIHVIRELKRVDEAKNFFLIFNDYIDHSISFTQGEKLINEIKCLQKRENFNVKLVNTYSKRYIHVDTWIEKNLNTMPLHVLSIFQRKMLFKKRKNNIYITMLAPGKKEIKDLMKEWKKDKIKREEGKKYSANSNIINKSSISLLIEYNGDSVLLTGDSTIELIKSKLDELGGKITHINYINLCHHGAGRNNRGILELIKNFNCDNVFLSTNSVKHPEHPCLSMLFQLLKLNTKLKIYLTNKLLFQEVFPEWESLNDKMSLQSDSQSPDNAAEIIFNKIENLEFPISEKNLKNILYEEKDKSTEIRVDLKQLCKKIKYQLTEAMNSGRIIVVSNDNFPHILIQGDKNEE